MPNLFRHPNPLTIACLRQAGISNFENRVGVRSIEPPLYCLFPSREGIDHVGCGKVKGIDDLEIGLSLFELILSDQAPA